MEFPNVTLQIKNNHAYLFLNAEDNTTTKIWEMDKSIDTVLLEIAKVIQLETDDIDEIVGMIREGDEKFLVFDEVKQDIENFSADAIVQQIKQVYQEYSPEDKGSKAVNDEIHLYWQSDVLASALEEIYNLLIAHTVFAASEVGTGNIVLDDARQEARLREKFSKELMEVAGLELIVV